MEFIGRVGAWFADPAHWTGSDGIPQRVIEHVILSGSAVLIASAIALPIGLYLGHSGKGAFLVINIANVGRALPSLALLAFALPISISLGLGLGFAPTLFALIPLAIPPILTNAFVAVRAVEQDVVEAARGMGLRESQILGKIELPLALPLVLGGLRTASVNVIATATLGAIIASGALGRYIVDGLALQDYERLFAGALLVALLAIATELGFTFIASLSRHTRSQGRVA